MPRAIIFDLDGTLLDTLEDLADSANEALQASGFDVHPTLAYNTFVGDGMHVLISRILPEDRRDEATLNQVLADYRLAYDRRWAAKTKPYPGVPELLRELNARGVPISVLSNKPQYFTELCVRHHLPDFTFRPLFGQRDHVVRKPDPAGAVEIARELGLETSDVLFVGDTRTDMETAVAAGMIPVGVSWGFRPVSELLEFGAVHIIHHPAELLNLV